MAAAVAVAVAAPAAAVVAVLSAAAGLLGREGGVEGRFSGWVVSTMAAVGSGSASTGMTVEPSRCSLVTPGGRRGGQAVEGGRWGVT